MSASALLMHVHIWTHTVMHTITKHTYNIHAHTHTYAYTPIYKHAHIHLHKYKLPYAWK